MLRSIRLLLLAPVLAFAATPASAQFPPDSLENIQVLPREMPVARVVAIMQGFTRALGVRCTHCHVGSEDIPLAQYDFVSDEKPEKIKARAMLRMVQAINDDHLEGLPDRKQPDVDVTCITCHRGIPVPRPLQQVLRIAYDAAGADSVEAAYRALRTRYYGGAAYDFGEVPLADVAGGVATAGNSADAIRLHQLNAEMNPASTFARRQLAETQLAAGDTTAAIASWRSALQINPNDNQSRAALRRLGQTP